MPVKEMQKTHSQHPVPQNIMDVEFKLIGDLTMRQFIYLVVFGLLGYVSSITVVGAFQWPLTLFFILLGLALAFVPIQERGMDEWVVNFVKAMYAPTQLIWRKEAALPSAFAYQNINVVRQELITLAPTSSRRKLEEYLELQHKEQSQDNLDIPETEYLNKVKEAFADVSAKSPLLSRQATMATATAAVSPAANQVEFVPFSVAQDAPAQTSDQQQPPISPEPAVSQNIPSVEEEALEINTAPVVIQQEQPKKAIKRTFPHAFGGAPSTLDRHVGRRFTNLLPSEGQLILPVRGETVLKTSEEIDIEKEINDRTNQLKRLLDQIRGDEAFKGIISSGVDISQSEGSKQKIQEAEDVVNKVKEENDRLSAEIDKLRDDLKNSNDTEEQRRRKEELINKLEAEKNQANTDYNALQNQILELQERLKKQEESFQKDQGAQKKEASYAKMQPITTEPNILSGILLDPERKAVEGSVLLIKNHKGEAVRAVKTNTIGQFSISTPLVNGMYTIEVGTAVEGVLFDIITVEVKGEVIPPIEILGRFV